MRFLEKLNNTDIELTALTVWIARKTFTLNRVEFYEALGGMIRDGTPSLRALEFLCEIESKRLARTVLIFTERSDQLSRATDRVP
ncbi:hypothetical protein MZE13_23730, partial [Escherichia coli]|nr:hypothetical protein [Escherichia coli]